MSTTVEQLAQEAMKLPGESRARLADLLVESLESGDLTDIDRCGFLKRSGDAMKFGRVPSRRFLATKHFAVFVTPYDDEV